MRRTNPERQRHVPNLVLDPPMSCRNSKGTWSQSRRYTCLALATSLLALQSLSGCLFESTRLAIVVTNPTNARQSGHLLVQTLSGESRVNRSFDLPPFTSRDLDSRQLGGTLHFVVQTHNHTYALDQSVNGASQWEIILDFEAPCYQFSANDYSQKFCAELSDSPSK
jgi:hypothetical protein